MPETFPASVTVGDRTVPLLVVRKAVRNLNARMDGETLRVSAPLHADRKWIDESIPVLARRLLHRTRRREVNRDGLALEVARRVAARFEHPPAVESVEFEAGRTSVWGTYDPNTRRIRLSASLRHMPAEVLEGVVAHELCHAVWRNHGPRFRALLRRVCPGADRTHGFLEGASWFARHGAGIPETDLGPLAVEPTSVQGDAGGGTAGVAPASETGSPHRAG